MAAAYEPQFTFCEEKVVSPKLSAKEKGSLGGISVMLRPLEGGHWTWIEMGGTPEIWELTK